MDAAIFIANRCIVNPLQLRLSESVLLYGTRQYYIHTCVPDLVGTYRETVERYNNNGRRVKKKKTIPQRINVFRYGKTTANP